MTELNFFQRYSQREDHITNNVLLMLRHLYRENPRKLEVVLNSLLDDGDALPVGITFEQQVTSSKSRPDGRIMQEAWDIRIEVKPGSHWEAKQLQNHLAGFNRQARNFLLLLSTDVDAAPELSYTQCPDVKLITATFNDILDSVDCEEVVAKHETGLREIVEDFRSILASNGLLPNPYLLYAFNCAGSMKANLAGKLYYEPASRPTKIHVLNGFYGEKRLQAIGRADFTLEVEPSGEIDVSSFKAKNGAEFTAQKAVDWLIKTGLPGQFSERMRFYCYHKEFVAMEAGKIDFTKDTRGGYMGGVWLNLRHWLDVTSIDATDIEKVALNLNNKSFGRERGLQKR